MPAWALSAPAGASPLPLRYWPNGQLDDGRRSPQYSGMAGAPLIAVVDDDPSVLRALMRLLRTRSFGAKTYNSALEFLASLPGEAPDCLVVDLQMPGMSGLELHQYLTGRGIEIPTIIITAHDEGDARQRCELAGVAAYLLKPIEDTALLDAIANARQRGE